MDTQNSTAPAMDTQAVVAPVNNNTEVKVVVSKSEITFDGFKTSDTQKARY